MERNIVEEKLRTASKCVKNTILIKTISWANRNGINMAENGERVNKQYCNELNTVLSSLVGSLSWEPQYEDDVYNSVVLINYRKIGDIVATVAEAAVGASCLSAIKSHISASLADGLSNQNQNDEDIRIMSEAGRVRSTACSIGNLNGQGVAINGIVVSYRRRVELFLIAMGLRVRKCRYVRHGFFIDEEGADKIIKNIQPVLDIISSERTDYLANRLSVSAALARRALEERDRRRSNR